MAEQERSVPKVDVVPMGGVKIYTPPPSAAETSDKDTTVLKTLPNGGRVVKLPGGSIDGLQWK